MQVTLDPDSHTYRTACGTVLPSVTQILRATLLRNRFAAVPDAVRDRAGARGRQVHEAVRLWDQGVLDARDLEARFPDVVGYLDAWQRFRRETPGFSARLWEVPLGHDDEGYAGTFDVLGDETVGAGLVVDSLIDLKTGDTEGVREQTAAYVALARVNGLLRRSRYPWQVRRTCLTLRADGTYARSTPFLSYARDYARFTAARRAASEVPMTLTLLPDDGPPDDDTPPLENVPDDTPPDEAALVRAVPIDVPERPQEVAVATRARALADELLQLPVPTSHGEYVRLAGALELIATIEQAVHAEMDDVIADAHSLHRKLTARRAAHLKPLEDAKQHIGLIGGQWRLLERRREEEAQRAREAVARAEREAQAQVAAAALRQAAAVQADAARLDAARLVAAGQSAQALEVSTRADAVVAQAQQEAAAVLYDAVAAPVYVEPAAAPLKVAGLSGRESWTFEVVDRARIPREYWVLDEKSLQAVVTRQKGACAIPGIRVFATAKVQRSGRR